MAKTRADLDGMLSELEIGLPRLLQETDEDSFMEAFAGEADAIEDLASPGDIAHVRGRINRMLSSRGLIPGDDDDERGGAKS